MSGRCMVERFQRGGVRGFLHRPDVQLGMGAVLAHGAGANCEAKILVAVADALCGAGFVVLRIDMPFRQKRPTGPPLPGSAAEDRAGLREAVDALRSLSRGRIVLGGHSYGGRMSSMLAAEDSSVADALLLLSYPLHPPTKRDQLRTAHLPDVRTPALFVHGTRDPFGLPDEMREALKLLAGRVEFREVAGAGHDLRSGKFDVQGLLIEPLLDVLGPSDTVKS
ncbi:MAG TPA: alpha/beta fold hydrolase [Bryobacteraceae bacterium]|nr:alpha/beta fold hydrolase [Bryobacteraceae bacterium]